MLYNVPTVPVYKKNRIASLLCIFETNTHNFEHSYCCVQDKTFTSLNKNVESSFENPRVGSHMVFVRIHCTEKCPTSFYNDVLSESK